VLLGFCCYFTRKKCSRMAVPSFALAAKGGLLQACLQRAGGVRAATSPSLTRSVLGFLVARLLAGEGPIYRSALEFVFVVGGSRDQCFPLASCQPPLNSDTLKLLYLFSSSNGTHRATLTQTPPCLGNLPRRKHVRFQQIRPSLMIGRQHP
jgi:hypothetical protein